ALPFERFGILCATRPRCVLQVCGSSAPSRSMAHRVQTCLRQKWISSACRGSLRCCRFPGPTRRGARHNGRSGLRALLTPSSADLQRFVLHSPSTFLPSLCPLPADGPPAKAIKRNLLLPVV